MKQAKAIFWEDIKDSVVSRKIILIAAIVAFIFMSIYASGFLQIAYLLFFKPQNIIAFPITITYYLLFFTIPLFTLLLGHDSVSSEMENSTLRAVISKINRASFILGKFLSVFAIVASLSFLLLLTSSAYTFIKFKQLDVLHPFLFLLYLLLYIASLSSISIFFSTLLGRSSSALFSVTLFYIFLQYINFKTSAFLSIFSYMNNIISLENIYLPIIVFLIYLFIFLLASIIIFRVRDI